MQIANLKFQIERLKKKLLSVTEFAEGSFHCLKSSLHTTRRNRFKDFTPLQFAICNLQFALSPAVGTRGLAALLATALFAALPSAAPAELVDHIVAAVNNEVITASELAHTMALNERLGRLEPDGKTLEAETLDGLINRRLLVQEARRLRFVEVSDQEISAEVERLRKRFGSDDAFSGFLSTLDLAEPELARMLGEQLLVEKFVEKKVGLFVRVTREEVQNYFDSHAAEFQGKHFQDAQKAITELLTEQKVGQQLDQYVGELRGRADIRINPR